MKIGVFGGTFDPVHLGHLLLAETARDVCGLDQVWFVPAAQSPFKETSPRASAKQRIEMLRLAIAGIPAFRAYDAELKRTGPSYTIDTLTGIAQQHPDAELFLIIGSDSLSDFPRWRDPHGILELANVIAMNRGRTDASLDEVKRHLGEDAVPCFRIVEMPAVDFSSTALRSCCATGRSIRFQTPRAVEQYIHQNQLYKT